LQEQQYEMKKSSSQATAERSTTLTARNGRRNNVVDDQNPSAVRRCQAFPRPFFFLLGRDRHSKRLSQSSETSNKLRHEGEQLRSDCFSLQTQICSARNTYIHTPTEANQQAAEIFLSIYLSVL
jgi:hypothetical protein